VGVVGLGNDTPIVFTAVGSTHPTLGGATPLKCDDPQTAPTAATGSAHRPWVQLVSATTRLSFSRLRARHIRRSECRARYGPSPPPRPASSPGFIRTRPRSAIAEPFSTFHRSCSGRAAAGADTVSGNISLEPLAFETVPSSTVTTFGRSVAVLAVALERAMMITRARASACHAHCRSPTLVRARVLPPASHMREGLPRLRAPSFPSTYHSRVTCHPDLLCFSTFFLCLCIVHLNLTLHEYSTPTND
jgi:hypothetical protein